MRHLEDVFRENQSKWENFLNENKIIPDGKYQATIYSVKIILTKKNIYKIHWKFKLKTPLEYQDSIVDGYTDLEGDFLWISKQYFKKLGFNIEKIAETQFYIENEKMNGLNVIITIKTKNGYKNVYLDGLSEQENNNDSLKFEISESLNFCQYDNYLC